MGPPLLNIFINDFVSLVDCNKLTYADGLKIFNDIDVVADCVSLKASADAVSQ